jgi:tryptophan synthase alpha chain
MTTHAAGRSLLGPAHPANRRLASTDGTTSTARSSPLDGDPEAAALGPASPDDASARARADDGPHGGVVGRGGAGRGRKLLVTYLTAGVTADWVEYLFAMQEAGADAIEVGLPFSDPVLDGVTVQQSSDRALARGVTVASILRELYEVRDRVRVPLIAFTYSNLVFRPGPAAFCRQLAEAGVRGLIVPDLPVDEADVVEAAAAAVGIELTLLVAPVTPDDRLAEIVARSRGYVYAVSRMGTTGERDSLASSAAVVAARVKAAQIRPTRADGISVGAAPEAALIKVNGRALRADGRRAMEGDPVSRPDGRRAAGKGPALRGGDRRGGSDPAARGLTGRDPMLDAGRVVSREGEGEGRTERVPVLVGFGISGVEQVAAAGRAGDGVVVGSALMRRVLDGATPRELGAEVAALRGALDALD